MSDEPDDRDDPQLRSLRAVWLALPDEDPPTRGLEALMAAATAKAKEMAPEASESLWHKLLAVLRRPPMLALATVMILVGGAVLISQRDSIKDTAQPEMEQRRDKQAPAAAPATIPEPRAAETPPAEATKGHGAATIETKPTVEEPSEDHTVRRTPPTKPRLVDPKTDPKHDPKPPTLGGVKTGETSTKTPTGRTPGFVPPETQKTKLEGEATAEEALDETGKDAAKPTQDADTTRGPRQVMVDELLTKSRNAATRGDCEESRLIAQRIAKQDIAFYRSRVQTDAAIKKCIAATTTTTTVGQ